MKWKLSVRVILIAVIVLLFAACGKETEEASLSVPKVQNFKERKPEERKQVNITELYSEEGDAFDRILQQDFHYSYHVPLIQEDTAGASEINERIKELYEDAISDYMEDIRQDCDPFCRTVSYEVFYYEEICSLVIKKETYERILDQAGFYDEYKVFLYDMTKKVQLSKQDLFDKKGITEEEYMQATRCAAVQCFDDTCFYSGGDWSVENRATFSKFNHSRSKQVSQETFLSYGGGYLDEEGNLYAIVTIVTLSEFPWSEKPLRLELENNSETLKAEAKKVASALLQDGNLSLRLTQTGGEDFPVHGAYSSYKEMFFGSMYMDVLPNLYLLTEEGRVEYVDLDFGLSGEYFCVAGPLPDIEGVVSLEEGENEDGVMTYAVLEDGSKTELEKGVWAQRRSMSSLYCRNWAFSVPYYPDQRAGYENNYSLTIADELEVYLEVVSPETDEEFGHTDSSDDICEHPSVRMPSGGQEKYIGSLTHIGMTEEGEVFHYFMRDEEDNMIQGVIALRYYGYGEIELIELGGDGLIYDTPGERTCFGNID